MYIRALAGLREWLGTTEDQWTWTTHDGRCFENVVVEAIDGEEVVLQHQFGTLRLLIAELSDESLQRLRETSLWSSQGHHVESYSERELVSC
jgi:hypothetical protein